MAAAMRHQIKTLPALCLLRAARRYIGKVKVFWLFVTLAWAVPVQAGSFPPVQTVFIILMENHDWADFKGSPSAPYLNQTLLSRASYCEQYYNPPGLHPSLPNYIWLEAGTNFGIFDDNTPAVDHLATTNHLVRLLDRAGISWRAYQEDIIAGYVPLQNTNDYAVRHDPFVYFDDVTGTNNPLDPYGIAHIRPYSELAADLSNHTVARYNFITPNVVNDGHDPVPPDNDTVAQSDAWLAAEVPKLLQSAAYSNNGAIFITWDEGEGSDGPIGMIVLSPLARGGGYFNRTHYSHSSTLRSLQEIFGVGPLLGNAAGAAALDDLFCRYQFTDIVKTNGGGVRLRAGGVIPGCTNLVQASTNLVTWTAVSTNVTSTNYFIVSDNLASPARRFYRLVQLP